MPFNGSGGTSQPVGSIYPAVGATLIESAKANVSIADIYTMLASCIVKDGQTTTTALITFAQGLKVATTLGVGASTPAATGSGVTFPATQSASSDVNTLDDYEEGTWTPTLISTGGGTPTYNSAVGTYTKKGREVSVTFSIALTNTGTLAAGTLTIGALPFTALNSSGNRPVSAITWDNMTTSLYVMMARIVENTTTAALKCTAAAATSMSNVAVADIANNTVLSGSFTYAATA